MARGGGRRSRAPYGIVVVLAIVGAYALNRTDLDPSAIRDTVESLFRSLSSDSAERLIPASTPAPSSSRNPGVVTIATWNVRVLSDGSRDDAELNRIANMIGRFDLMAIQEVRDTRVLDRLLEQLPGWAYKASDPVGTSRHKERYAYFWRRDRVDLVGSPATVADPGNMLIREPFAATFRSGEFDFTLCTIHLLYGDSQTERRRELVLMDDVVEAVQDANGREQDVLLLGDFNFPPDDRGWQLHNWTPLITDPARTTIGDKSLYDNIWLNSYFTTEYGSKCGIVAFDVTDYAGDTQRASREMSDHRPVWAEFATTSDDDTDEYGDLSTASLRVGALP